MLMWEGGTNKEGKLINYKTLFSMINFDVIKENLHNFFQKKKKKNKKIMNILNSLFKHESDNFFFVFSYSLIILLFISNKKKIRKKKKIWIFLISRFQTVIPIWKILICFFFIFLKLLLCFFLQRKFKKKKSVKQTKKNI